MKKNRNPKGSFWERERCEYCNGMIREKEVELLKKKKETYLIFQHVPVGVCQRCGTRYFSANVLKIISETLRGSKIPKRKRTVSVIDLAAA